MRKNIFYKQERRSFWLLSTPALVIYFVFVRTLNVSVDGFGLLSRLL